MKDKIKELDKLEDELKEMKRYHHDAWMSYGSELCAGDMIRQEDELKKAISREDASQKPLGVWDKAIIIGPSHYVSLNKAVTSDKFTWETPLGKIKLFNTGFPTCHTKIFFIHPIMIKIMTK